MKVNEFKQLFEDCKDKELFENVLQYNSYLFLNLTEKQCTKLALMLNKYHKYPINNNIVQFPNSVGLRVYK